MQQLPYLHNVMCTPTSHNPSHHDVAEAGRAVAQVGQVQQFEAVLWLGSGSCNSIQFNHTPVQGIRGPQKSHWTSVCQFVQGLLRGWILYLQVVRPLELINTRMGMSV